MRKRRILISTNSAWNAYNFRAGLIRALLAEGHDVFAAAPQDDAAGKLEALGCRFLPLPMDNKGTSPRRDLDLARRYVKLMRELRPNIYLGFTIKPNVYGSLAAHYLGIPAINNVSGLGTVFIRKSWVTTVAKRLYRLALSRSHTVFFQNDDDRLLFISQGLVLAPSTALLPGSGIDLSAFQPADLPKKGEPVFLLISRLLYDKGVGEFVEAVRIPKQAGVSARFRLLGFLDAENRTAVPREVVDAWVAEGLVEYLGAKDDVRPFIASADCVVLPSYREGTPRTLLEAAAMARPIIATDVPGCREVVEHGVNGFTCTVRNPESLANAIRLFLAMSREERLQMGRMGREKVERQFDERVVIARYFETIGKATDLRAEAAA